MTHAVMVDWRPTSTTSGQEVQVPVTVIEAPPMRVAAVRLYRSTSDGLKVMAEIWTEGAARDLRGKVPLPDGKKEQEAPWATVDGAKVDEVRVLTYTQPSLVTGTPSKLPELMETRIGGGTIQERLTYARKILGSEVQVGDFALEGQVVDVCAVTKGKGFKGHHTRWGTKLLSHKNSKHRRMIGTLGGHFPSYVRPSVPQAGQTGYHQRTEFNKLILRIGEKGDEVNPRGGFVNYGVVRNPYILLKGSVPGPTKRLVRLRDPARPQKLRPVEKPEIAYLSLETKQGVP
jgi:large subunit ribosomal protein L3